MNECSSRGGGLSPRVRGNPPRPSCSRPGIRSIPACAGEPRARATNASHDEVYPRVCGGTQPDGSVAQSLRGLSPRVRGNLTSSCWRTRSRRSIPACAGEPGQGIFLPRLRRVYPRVCGGTVRAHERGGKYPGLSPRVRGNPLSEAPANAMPGSIPACAGEPAAVAGLAAVSLVYPRVCGGTPRG